MTNRLLLIDGEPTLPADAEAVFAKEGFELRRAPDGAAALEEIDKEMPDMLLLDLVMPGMHGFDVIRRLRNQPQTRHLPIVVITAQGYAVDLRKALVLGASRVFRRPIPVETLAAELRHDFDDIRVTFWGVRGSIPTPGPSTVRFGGNTPCVTVEHRSSVVVFDAGTGIRAAGQWLMQRANGEPLLVPLLLSHCHWDHIQGLPFFAPLYFPGGRIDIYGPAPQDGALGRVLLRQMEAPYFPVTLCDTVAMVEVTELVGDHLDIGPFRITYSYVNHPGPTLAYRIEVAGRAIVYATDNEPYQRMLAPLLERRHEDARHHRAMDESLVRFAHDADLLIQDAQYSPEDYDSKVGWGHTSYVDAVDMALKAGARRLALFSHDATQDDDAVEYKERVCRERAQAHGGSLDVWAAAEGQVITVPRNGR